MRRQFYIPRPHPPHHRPRSAKFVRTKRMCAHVRVCVYVRVCGYVRVSARVRVRFCVRVPSQRHLCAERDHLRGRLGRGLLAGNNNNNTDNKNNNNWI